MTHTAYPDSSEHELKNALIKRGLSPGGEIFLCACQRMTPESNVEEIAEVALLREKQVADLRVMLEKHHFSSSHCRHHQAVRRVRLGEPLEAVLQDTIRFEARARQQWLDLYFNPWLKRHNLTVVQALSLLRDSDDYDPKNPSKPLVTLKDVSFAFRGQTDSFVAHICRELASDDKQKLSNFYQSLIT